MEIYTIHADIYNSIFYSEKWVTPRQLKLEMRQSLMW